MRFNILLDNLSSEEYHGEGNSFSSSQLKTMLEDPEIFYKKYITKEIGRESSSAFDLGTYFHTAILEPHKLEEECCVFGGAVRNGKKWDDFKEENKGKAIITEKEKVTAEKMISAFRGSPISSDLIANSRPEISTFVEVYVMGDEIFSFRGETCFNLTPAGWVPTTGEFEESDIKDFGVKLILKVRADALGIGNGTISDLKSTSGNAAKKSEVMRSIGTYQYDLSAALYLDLFTISSGEEYDTFIWIFASKDFGNCRPWKASQRHIMVGRAKWKYAVVQLAKYISNGWQFVEEMEEVDAPYYAIDEWLNR